MQYRDKEDAVRGIKTYSRRGVGQRALFWNMYTGVYHVVSKSGKAFENLEISESMILVGIYTHEVPEEYILEDIEFVEVNHATEPGTAVAQ